MTEQNNTPYMRLELVPVPVSDVERAIAFYADKLGFNVDHDTKVNETTRFVQLTPPGSGCSILVGVGMGEISEMMAGSLRGLHLVVKDVREMRDLLASRGVELGEIIEYPRGIKYVHFRDPDGNSWALQEIPPNL